jgi:hypothetical protein
MADARAKLACSRKFALGRLDGQDAGCDDFCVAVRPLGLLGGKQASFLSALEGISILAAQRAWASLYGQLCAGNCEFVGF